MRVSSRRPRQADQACLAYVTVHYHSLKAAAASGQATNLPGEECIWAMRDACMHGPDTNPMSCPVHRQRTHSRRRGMRRRVVWDSGVLAVTVAAIAFSLSGLFVKLIEDLRPEMPVFEVTQPPPTSSCVAQVTRQHVLARGMRSRQVGRPLVAVDGVEGDVLDAVCCDARPCMPRPCVRVVSHRSLPLGRPTWRPLHTV
jgi:hypothetical protein